MQVASVSDFRKDIKKYIDAVDNNQEALIVTRTDSVSVVVIPLDEYNSIKETEYLLSSKANREHLKRGMANVEAGNLIPKTIEELRQYE